MPIFKRQFYTGFVALILMTSCGQTSLDKSPSDDIPRSPLAKLDSSFKETPLYQQCLKRRKIFYQSVSSYQNIPSLIKKTSLPESYFDDFLFCQEERLATDYFDLSSSSIFVHELTHHLGSYGEMVSAQSTTKKKVALLEKYKYIIPRQRYMQVAVSYSPEALKTNELYMHVKDYAFLANVERFLRKDNNSSFYILLDEWNAFLEEFNFLNLTSQGSILKDKDYCRPGEIQELIKSSAWAALEFELFNYLALKLMKQERSTLYKRLRADKELVNFFKLLSHDTRMIRKKLKSLDCSKYKTRVKQFSKLFLRLGLKKIVREWR